MGVRHAAFRLPDLARTAPSPASDVRGWGISLTPIPLSPDPRRPHAQRLAHQPRSGSSPALSKSGWRVCMATSRAAAAAWASRGWMSHSTDALERTSALVPLRTATNGCPAYLPCGGTVRPGDASRSGNVTRDGGKNTAQTSALGNCCGSPPPTARPEPKVRPRSPALASRQQRVASSACGGAPGSAHRRHTATAPGSWRQGSTSSPWNT